MAHGARWAIQQCGSDWSLGQGPFQQRLVRSPPRVHEFGSGSSIIATDSLSELKSLLAHQDAFDNVCFDRVKAPSLSDGEQWRQWIHGTLSLLETAQQLLQRQGRALVHIDSRDLVTVLRLAAQCSLHLEEVLAWGKKYAGQQVARTVEPLHDLILVFGSAPPQAAIDATFLPWRVVGKSEDAAREFRESDFRSTRPGLAPPAPLKPRGLFSWLVRERLSSAGRVLDLTSCGASFSEHLRDQSATSVDVLWADVEWSVPSAYLVAERLELQASEVVGLVQSSSVGEVECSCKLIPANQVRSQQEPSHVRVRREPTNGDSYVVGSSSIVAAAIGHFFRSSVDVFQSHITSTPNLAGGIRESLTSTGLAIIDLDGDWQADALEVADELGPEVELGQLVVPESLDEVCSMKMSMLFMKDGTLLTTVGPAGRRPQFGNEDGDPRGAWRDPRHKGAKSGGPGTSFTLDWPPYRWRIVGGDLPPGLWRLSPDTGVVWGTPAEEGKYEIVVEVSDAQGATAQERLVFTILSSAGAAAVASGSDLEPVWWLSEAPRSGGPLEVVTTAVQMTRGVESSRTLRAAGGFPARYSVEPPGQALERGRTRYWEFSFDSFVRALQQDAVIFPEKAGTRPRIKKYERQSRSRARAPLPSVLSPTGAGEPPSEAVGRLIRKGRAEVVVLRSEAVEQALRVRVHHAGAFLDSWEAFDCADCNALSTREDGCSAQHAVQSLTGLTPAVEDITEYPVDLITLDGRPGGLLIPEQPVTETSLRSILSGRGAPARPIILARRREKSLSVTSRVRVVSWPR